MCLAQIFKVEDDETRRSLFALLCFINAQRETFSPHCGKEARDQGKTLKRQAREINDFFLNHCLV